MGGGGGGGCGSFTVSLIFQGYSIKIFATAQNPKESWEAQAAFL